MRQLAEVSKFQTKCGEAIEQYLNEKDLFSVNTESSYRGDLQRFFKDVFDKSINNITAEELNSIDYDTIVKYRQNLKKVLANSTINRHMNSIKKTIEHLKTINILESNIAYFSRINKLPLKTESAEYMPLEIVDRYIEEAGKQKNYPELKQSIIKFAVDTGLRLDEVVNFKLNQFTVDGDKVKVKGYGKGSKEYIDWMSIELYEELIESMQTENHPNNRLFHPLNTKNITDMMGIIKKSLGYEHRGFSFHSFKVTALTTTYRVTGCVLAAQRKGRHSNLNTTRGYLKDEEFGITGAYSMRDRNFDQELYKKTTEKELLEALGDMNKDFLFLLNTKLREIQSKN